MSERSAGRSRKWLGALGMLLLLGAITVAAGAVSNMLVADNAAPASAWYADSPAPAEQVAGDPATAEAPAATKGDAQAARSFARSMSAAFQQAATRVLPAVVAITSVRGDDSPAADEGDDEDGFGRGSPFDMFRQHPELRQFFRDMPRSRVPMRRVSSGSGVIVDPAGVILTNNHVVAGGGKVTVRLQDGREFKATEIKTDPKTEVAIVRIKGEGELPVAKLGDSSKLEVGDWVLALGQPFGLQGTVTAGIISAKGRGIGISEREDYLQTDAAINPGNSGGPLVTLDGEVIGINTAIASNSGGYQGIGFAVPINLAKWVGGQLATAGKVNRAYLGVLIQPVTQSLADQFNVKVRQGVVVTDVTPDSPAAKAGIKQGDILLTFAGKTVSNPRELQGIVEMVKPGSTRPVTLIRDGKNMTIDVTVAEMPANYNLARAMRRGGAGETSSFGKLGIQAEDLTSALAEQLGLNVQQGAVITDVRAGSPAEAAGLSSGMVITEANRQPVKNVADLRNALSDRSLQKGVLLLVRSAEGSRFVVIRSGGEE